MKRVEVGVRSAGDPIHPLVPFLTGPDVARAAMVDWNGVVRPENPDESTVVLRVHADPSVVREAFAAEPVVDEFHVSVADEDCCYVHAHSETARLEGATAKSLTPPGVVAVPPLRYEDDGWMVLTLVGDDAPVQAAIERVPDEIEVTVRSVASRGYGAATDPLACLTDRQRDAVFAAVDAGYYEVPRTGDVAAVADDLDCADSTAAEHLRKAESRLVASLVASARA
ncbi:helix-turn-helix domain-containing protein [Halobacterium litoreum]|uniref:Helix-turn-helix domain-containing protein n=1 Tax=Halobacterium litoreum TaxID=2039234 RepID=A0ABD5NG82_9EURY|nr:helix-turn-helix domain-containing protein [Halobacterium litoreum]UHH12874.1 helix-turn-helix domain-containing protein [Halobacterium litoreum]